MRLDEKDSELLEQLSKNGKASQRELARETGVALGTVNTHIRKLENERVIKGYFADIDAEKVGFNLTAIIYLRIKIGTLIDFAGINNPHCAIKQVRPNVRSTTVFPPAFGPVINIKLLLLNKILRGTYFFSFSINSGFIISSSSILRLLLTVGLMPPILFENLAIVR